MNQKIKIKKSFDPNTELMPSPIKTMKLKFYDGTICKIKVRCLKRKNWDRVRDDNDGLLCVYCIQIGNEFSQLHIESIKHGTFVGFLRRCEAIKMAEKIVDDFIYYDLRMHDFKYGKLDNIDNDTLLELYQQMKDVNNKYLRLYNYKLPTNLKM